ncbi:MAG TPA: ester cyclase [Thermoanaerobaculia bacterium]|nr:ester cyclase [Thermoanaerobaculia bacterium]
MLRQISRFLTAALAIAFLASPAVAGELEEKNKALARIVFEEVLGKGRIEENEPIYSPSFVAHGMYKESGRVEDREATKGWRQAFPDLKITVDKIVAEGEMVAVRFIGEGTHTGSGNGLAATGKSIRVAGMTMFRIVDGKITEEWSSFDQMDLLRQLGLLPAGSK